MTRKRLHIECEPCGEQKIIKVTEIASRPGEVLVDTIDMWCHRCASRDFKLVDQNQPSG